MTSRQEKADPSAARSTEPDDPTPNWDRFDRALRVLVIAVIFVVIAAAMAGIAGLRTDTASSASATFNVQVHYGAVSRPGLATPLRVAVKSANPGPLPDTVSISIGNDYLAMFDQNSLQPTPDTSELDGETLTWTYELDNQTQLLIDVDARLQPDIHRGRSTNITVTSPGEEPVSVAIHTRVFG